MVDIETFFVAVRNLRHQRLRTFLTLLGVIIGIAAIVALVSIGEGLNQSVTSQFEKLGSNTIFVIPGSASLTSTGSFGGKSVFITENDVSRIEGMRGVSLAIPIYANSGKISFGKESGQTLLLAGRASETKFFEDVGFAEVESGRMLQSNDGFAVVIGKSLSEKGFSKKIYLRNNIIIEGKKFKVVGILKESSTSFGGGPNTNTSIMMTDKAFKQIFPESEIGFLFVKTVTTDDINAAQTQIEKYFKNKYGENQFTIMSSQQILDQIQVILGLISLFLGGIAAISLIVGGIGIMNSMLMSVMERTREIGVMKAVGATRNKILGIFLLEAGLIGLIGGILGVLLGTGLSFLISVFGSAMGGGLTPVVTPTLVIGGLAFAMVVGILSGLYPALRAAKLDPVEALRYE